MVLFSSYTHQTQTENTEMNLIKPMYPSVRLGNGNPLPPQGPDAMPCAICSRIGKIAQLDTGGSSAILQPQPGMNLCRLIPHQGLIVQFSGPTGVGKGELSKGLLALITGSERLVTCTTRARREGEEHGKDYWFMSEDEFDDHLRSGNFVETNTYATGKRYGTLFNKVHAQMDRGGLIISDIDVAGAEQMRAKGHRLPGMVLDLFIMPPGESLEGQLAECRRRAEGSGAKRDDLDNRLAKAPEEIARSVEFTHIIVNDVFERALGEIFNIVSEARLVQFRIFDSCAV